MSTPSGKVEPDRIAQLGGRHAPESSVSTQLRGRLGGWRPKSQGRSNGPRPAAGNGAAPGGSSRLQRVTVKARVSSHRSAAAKSSLSRHSSYLTRDSASRDGQSGQFFNAAGQVPEARAGLDSWNHDRHHFRLIVSPERGNDLELATFTRATMARMSADLGTPLEYLAIPHHNTDNPHVHILVRGRKPDGSELRISRDYLSHTLRYRAREVATGMLGERSQEQVRAARYGQVQAPRPTGLDTLIQRHLRGDTLDLNPQTRIGFGADDRRRVIGRLQYLQSLGLAQKGRGTLWRVNPQYTEALAQWAHRRRLIKRLYPLVGADAGRVQDTIIRTVVGPVVAKGPASELSNRRTVIVRENGHLWSVSMPGNAVYDRLQMGSIVEIIPRAGAQQRPPKLRLLSVQGLAAQIQADALTWLDRQRWREQQEKQFADSPDLHRAQVARKRWLAEQGYIPAGEGELSREAALRLLRQEQQQFQKTLTSDRNMDVRTLRPGESISGTYRGTKELFSGPVAAVATTGAFYVAPVKAPPSLAIGAPVVMRRDTGRHTTIEPLQIVSQERSWERSR